MRMADLARGSHVVGNDGRRVATIRSVGEEYIVAAPRASLAVLHIPATAVANVKAGVVWLNVASAAIELMGWHVPPRTDDAVGTHPMSDLHRHV